MTPQEIAAITIPEIPNYCNQELEALMNRVHWKTWVKEVLNVDDRHAVRYYLHCKKNHSDFCSATVPRIEAVVAKINAAIEREKFARWVIRNRETGLYWCAIIEPPYWGRVNKAFLFDELTARQWQRKWYKTTGDFRMQIEKIYPVKRLNKAFKVPTRKIDL